MRPPALALLRLIACLGLAWQPCAAVAQDEDVQLWVYAVAEGDVSDDLRLTLDGTARWREDARGDEQQTLRFNLDTAVADGVRVGGGFGIFEDEDGTTELRSHEQLTLGIGRFSARTRIEQRFFDGADQVELRFRQRLGYTQPVAPRLNAKVEGEYFHLVQTRNRDPLAARDQWRGRILGQYRLRENLALALAYLVIYNPRPQRIDQVNHVPQAIVTYQF